MQNVNDTTTQLDQKQQKKDGDCKVDFDGLVHKVNQVPRLMEIGIATCHAVTTLNGQFIGNPVDIEMFKSSQWTLSDQTTDYLDTFIPPTDVTGSKTMAPMNVLQRFEFVHARMSMSVAVLDSSTNKIHVFVKGAYEKIKDLSIASSIPSDYDQVTSDLARQGCYVSRYTYTYIYKLTTLMNNVFYLLYKIGARIITQRNRFGRGWWIGCIQTMEPG